ncbi:MAG TPA: hypothetical protein VEC99_19170 [Clostridia bacterium]|nr:hypothetical protein [Clostridia bacterium]
MGIVEPKTYFQKSNLLESVPLKLHYAPERSEFELVLAYANIDRLVRSRIDARSNPLTREFKRLLFSEVTRPRRENVLLKTIDPARLDYSASEVQQQAVQNISLQKRLDVFSIRIGFGTFGDYLFTFKVLAEEKRTGSGVLVGRGKWEYIDVETGQRFDFHNPFPSPDNSGNQ